MTSPTNTLHGPEELNLAPPNVVWVLIRQWMLLITLFGIVCLALRYPSDDWYVRLGLLVITSYLFFNFTSLFHETVHHTLPGTLRSNIIAGRIVGTLLLVPYTCYRESHIRHHAYLNRPNDWELWPYSDPHASLTFRRVFVWLDLILGVFMAPYVYGRTFFHPQSPIRRPEIRRAIVWEYVVILLFWGTTLGLVAWYGNWIDFLFAWALPHWIAGVLQVGRKLTEHLGMSSFDPLQGTRTVIGRNWFSRFCSYMNFDIFVHGPHHRYPKITSDQLKSRMSEHLQKDAGCTFPLYPSYFAAVKAMLPCLLWRPGVGVNAGAAGVNEVVAEDVSEFLEDAREVTAGDWDSVES